MYGLVCVCAGGYVGVWSGAHMVPMMCRGRVVCIGRLGSNAAHLHEWILHLPSSITVGEDVVTALDS